MAVETQQPQVLTVPEALQWADQLPTDTPALSVFADTSPSRLDGDALLVAYRSGAQAVRNGLAAADRPAFDAAAAAVEGYFAPPFVPPARGLAIYVVADRDPVAVPLPFSPRDEVVWAERPAIEPLLQALDDFQRYAVVLIDKERTRFFTVMLGAIEERLAFADEVDGKQATGGWYGLQQKRMARHHEDQVLKHVKRTVAVLSDELRSYPYDRLFIGGSDEAVALLKHQLPKPLAQRLAGTVRLELFAGEPEVLAATLELAEQAERRAELGHVRELLETTNGHTIVGLESTLAALHTGNVSRLFVAETMPRTGRHCVDCGRLTSLRPCPVCMGETEAIPDLRERAVERAADIGARVDIVHGAASAALLERGGLGAWTRRSEH